MLPKNVIVITALDKRSNLKFEKEKSKLLECGYSLDAISNMLLTQEDRVKVLYEMQIDKKVLFLSFL